MRESPDILRCLRLIDQQSRSSNWNLLDDAKLKYAWRICETWDKIATATDEQVVITIRNFHADHMLVDALLDDHQQGHDKAWEDWSHLALRVVAFHAMKLSGSTGAVDLDDLRQQALLDLWRGLGSFSFQSRLRTWAITVIAHCVARKLRAEGATKRTADRQALSLDALQETGEPSVAESVEDPALVLIKRELWSITYRSLQDIPDQRARMAFELWVTQEKSMRAIGEQLHLSPARIHALIQLAIARLRLDLSHQGWHNVSDRSSDAPALNTPGQSVSHEDRVEPVVGDRPPGTEL